MEERQFVGARRGDDWYCRLCFDILFGVGAARLLVDYGTYGGFVVVYQTDEWVQQKVCFFCEEPFIQEEA